MRWRLLILCCVLALVGAAGYGGWRYATREAPFVRARRAVAEHQAKTALVLLLDHTKRNPRDAEAYYLLGRTYVMLNTPAAAERDLKIARNLGYDRASVMALLAPLYLADGRSSAVLAEVPDDGATPELRARALSFRTRAFIAEKDMRQARAAAAAAATLAPRDPDVQIALARVNLADDRVDVAVSLLERALATRPGDLEAGLLLSQVQFGRGERAAGFEALDAVVTANPYYPGPRLNRANILLDAGETAKAKADIQAVLALNPAYPPALYLQSALDLDSGSYGEAVTSLEKLGKAGANFPRAQYFQALAALSQNLPASAVEFASRYVGRNPGDPDGVRLLARSQIAAGQPEQALSTLRGLRARGPATAGTLGLVGEANEALGNVGAAADAYRAILELGPSERARLALMRLEVTAGRGQAAIDQLQADPGKLRERPEALQSEIAALLAQGEADRAAAALTRLTGLSGPTEATAVLTGMLQVARLEPEKAVETFADGVKTYPQSLVLPLDLAKALSAAGRDKEALAQLGALLARAPGDLDAVTAYVQIAVAQGEGLQAVRVINAARAAAPGDERLTAMLSDVLVRSGSASEALSMLEGPQVRSEGSALLLAARGRAQAALDKGVEAAGSLKAAFAMRPDAAVAEALVALELGASDRAGAAASLDGAIARLPGDEALLRRRVDLERELRGDAAALRLAEALQAEAAQEPASGVLPGDLLLREGRAAEAAAAFRAWMVAHGSRELALHLAEAEIAAKDAAGAVATLRSLAPGADAAVLWLQLDVERKEWVAAVRDGELALTARPNDPALLNDLAYAYSEQGDARARAAARRAYLLDPSPEVSDTLGWIMVNEGKAAEAVPVLRQAAAGRPGDAAIGYHLAKALAAAGQPGDARPVLEAALRGSGAFEGRGEAEGLLASLGGK